MYRSERLTATATLCTANQKWMNQLQALIKMLGQFNRKTFDAQQHSQWANNVRIVLMFLASTAAYENSGINIPHAHITRTN